MTVEGDDDAALLQAWLEGAAWAGDALIARHYASVRRFFDLKATRVADDLTQATFLGLLERRDAFRGVASFKSYLFGIARHQLLRYIRKQGRGTTAMRFAEASADVETYTPLSLVAARHQEQHLLLLALAQLPIDYQITVELFYWEEMRVVEIGEALTVTESTVTTRLSRARSLLRDEIMKLSRPGRLRDALLADLDGWNRSLGPATLAANSRSR